MGYRQWGQYRMDRSLAKQHLEEMDEAMSKSYEEMRDDTVAAYEEATGQLPDTRDYVAIEEVVKDYTNEVNDQK